MTTIVTSYIDNVNDMNRHQNYTKHSRYLLEINIPKIIFIEKHNINLVPCTKYNTIIEIDRKDVFDINNKNIKLPSCKNVLKDTLNYLILMNQKTEFIRKAIELNPYNTKQFIWIDFGIKHVVHDDDLFKKYINQMVSKQYNQVRIASIWNEMEIQDNFNKINWTFAGGVFGGDSESLLVFSDNMKRIFTNNINRGQLTWEVNLWYDYYLTNKELFSCYKCDHNTSMVENY